MRKFFATEGAKLKNMNFTEKRQYIWEYYKMHMLFIGIVAVVIGLIINTVLNPPMRTYLYVAWIDESVHPQRLEALGERLSVIAENQERYEVIVNSYVMTGAPGHDRALSGRLNAQIRVGDVHAFMSGQAGVEVSAANGLIAPVYNLLDEIEALSPYLYAEVRDRLFFVTGTTYEGDEITAPMAISLSGIDLFAQLGIDSDGIYISIVSGAGRLYEVAKAIEVLLFAPIDEY